MDVDAVPRPDVVALVGVALAALVEDEGPEGPPELEDITPTPLLARGSMAPPTPPLPLTLPNP